MTLYYIYIFNVWCQIHIIITCCIYRAPFDVSMTVLVIMTVIIVFTWTENYGDKTTNISHSFTSAWHSIRTGKLFTLFTDLQQSCSYVL